MRKVWRGTQLGIGRWRDREKETQTEEKDRKWRERKKIRRRVVVIVSVVVLEERGRQMQRIVKWRVVVVEDGGDSVCTCGPAPQRKRDERPCAVYSVGERARRRRDERGCPSTTENKRENAQKKAECWRQMALPLPLKGISAKKKKRMGKRGILEGRRERGREARGQSKRKMENGGLENEERVEARVRLV